MRCMAMEVTNMSTRLKRKYRDIAWRYIRILGFERTISFMASNNFHPE